jgi:LPS export ABC transporter protein LptC
MRLLARAAAASAFLLAAGCSLDYTAASLPESTTEGIPDTVATGITHRIVKGSRLSFEMEAERAETYGARKQTILSAARFTEYDDKGGAATEGSADTVVYHTDTEDAEISGSITVYSAAQKGSISTQTLSWKNKERRLTASPEERVVVTKDDGSYIRGTGFIGDFRTNQIQFTGPVEGRYVYNEE